jgi:hypothetical protein
LTGTYVRDAKRGRSKRRDPYKDPARRYINKREGVRHVLHAAIRAALSGEDPFAIHLLGQSAEKVLIDLLENEGIKDPLFSLLKPDMRSVFFDIYRESYNFLKHADQDSDGKLTRRAGGVRNIVGSNDLLLFTSILRYGVLFGSYTQHMWIFLKFAGFLYPGIVDCGEAITITRLAMQQNPDCQREAQQDLDDVTIANSTKVEEYWRRES